MRRIHLHERALLYRLLEGTEKTPGLRHIEGVTVCLDTDDLTKRDLIVAMQIKNFDYTECVAEYQRHGVTVYERVNTNKVFTEFVSGAPTNVIDLSEVNKTKDYLLEGHVDFEFRTTVVKQFHKVADIVKIGEWIKGAERYYLQKFTDSGDLIGEGLSAPTDEKLRACLAADADPAPGFAPHVSREARPAPPRGARSARGRASRRRS